MNIVANKNWITSLNNISSKYLMPVMAVSFILFNTVINMWLGERIETLQNFIAILILGVLACNILANPRKMIPMWIKENLLVILYLGARLISLWQSNFDYSVIRSIFFEVFFLIGICSCTASGKKRGELYVKLFLWIELFFTLASLVLFYIMPLLGTNIQETVISMTYYERSGNAMLFSNPNTAGIMTGFAVVIAIICYGKNYFSNKFIIFYGIYNLIALFLFGCRSSDMGIVAVLLVLAIIKFFPVVKGKTIAVISLILMVSTLIPIYAFISFQSQEDPLELSQAELKLESLSTGRYAIWKECYMTQQGDFLFGDGSLKLEQEERKEMVSGIDRDYYWRFCEASELGPHNGYIGMISGAGIVGLGLFVIILLQRMKRCRNLEKDKWYLALIFIFVINCFESLFILNRFFTCFYMFLILEAEFESEQ